MDAFEMAFCAEVARRNGDARAAEHFDVECGRAVSREIAANREWSRKLHGKE